MLSQNKVNRISKFDREKLDAPITVRVIFHGGFVRLCIKKNRAVLSNPGHAKAVSLHIFQKCVAVLFRSGNRKA